MSGAEFSQPLRLGTRGSLLARTQSELVADHLRGLGATVELVRIATQGDASSEPLQQIGGQGVFTKDIQRALLDGRVDFAVHSLKDLPTAITPGLQLVATPPRMSVADVLVPPQNQRLGGIVDLENRSRIGTGSVRRRAQLLHARDDLVMLDIRGNVDTRLKHLDQGRYDALVLAEAGLARLGISRPYWAMPQDLMLPAVGQGALGLECREDDPRVVDWLSRLNDFSTFAAVGAERALLAHLQGGCLAPVAAWGRVEPSDGLLHLDAVVLEPSGQMRLFDRIQGVVAEATQLGRQLGERLLAKGAGELMRK